MPNPEAQIDLTMDTAAFKRQAASVSTILKRVRTSMLAVSRAAKFMLLGQIASFALAVKAASDYEETFSKFEAVFKDQAQAAKAWADEMAKAMNRSTVAMLGFLAGLQDVFVPFGFAREEARKLSQEVTRLGVDLASFNNMADAEVVNALTTALTGSHETVKKFGVIINEVTLKEALLTMGIKGGTKVATEQQKVLARLNILLAATSDAQGDAIRTAGSLANQMRGLKAAFLDLATDLGTIFLPLATTLIGRTGKLVVRLSEWTKAHGELVKKMVLGAVGITAFMALVSPLDELGKVLVLTYRAAAFAMLQFGAAVTAVNVLGLVGAIKLLILNLGVLATSYGVAMKAATAFRFATNPLVIALALVAAALISTALAARKAKNEMRAAEEASLRTAKTMRRLFGTEPEDLAEFADAPAKAFGRRAAELRELIADLGAERKILEGQLHDLGGEGGLAGFPPPEGRVTLKDRLRENIAIIERQIDTWKKEAQAASSAARERITAAKAVAEAEAEFFGVSEEAQAKKVAALQHELDALRLTDRQIHALTLTVEGHNEAQIKVQMALWDTVAAEQAMIAATEEAREASIREKEAIDGKRQSLEEEAAAIRKQIRALKAGVSIRKIELFDLQNVQGFKKEADEIIKLMAERDRIEEAQQMKKKKKDRPQVFETIESAWSRISLAAARIDDPQTKAAQTTATATARTATAAEKQLEKQERIIDAIEEVSDAVGGPAVFAP